MPMFFIRAFETRFGRGCSRVPKGAFFTFIVFTTLVNNEGTKTMGCGAFINPTAGFDGVRKVKMEGFSKRTRAWVGMLGGGGGGGLGGR